MKEKELDDRANMELTRAAQRVADALSTISREWERLEAVRTPRMADAVSLLERGRTKLLKALADGARGK